MDIPHSIKHECKWIQYTIHKHACYYLKNQLLVLVNCCDIRGIKHYVLLLENNQLQDITQPCQ